MAPSLLLSCNNNNQVDLSGRFQLEPYSSLEEMQKALRLNKGHLSKEMQRVTATKDAEQIFNFVQQRFATIPSLPYRIDDETSVHRWGIRGLLRCGKGTLREKSDLLYIMLQKANLTPSYHYSTFKTTPDIIKQVFCAKKLDNNSFEAPKKYTEKWKTEFQKHDVKTINTTIENADDKVTKLTKQLLAKLPINYEQEIQVFKWLDTKRIQAPVVRIETENGRKDLEFISEKPYKYFQESTSKTYSLNFEKKSKVIDTVRVIIRATYSDNITKPMELVRGEWPLTTLVGRQVVLQFNTPVPTAQLLLSSYQQVNQFIPFLTLRAPELPLIERKKHSFKGVGFDLYGNLFENDGDGAIRMNGLKMNEVTEQDTSKIKTLKAIVSEEAYPKIQVRLAPLDIEGNPVIGLGGSAFTITDQEQDVLPVIIQNTLSPNILILTDTTASMPLPYSYGKLPDEIRNEISTAINTVFYDHTLSIATHQQDLKEKLEGIDRKIYDHIIIIGDAGEFANIDMQWFKGYFKDTSMSYHYIKSITNKFDESENPAMLCFRESEKSYGIITDIEKEILVIAKVLKNTYKHSYILEYEAPEGDDYLKHDVVIGVANNDNVTNVHYTYNYQREGKIYTESRYPCGLSMEMQWTENYNSKSIIRHLVGFDAKKHDTAIPVYKENVKGFVMGTHLLCFEADKATYPAMMDDILSDPISLAPFMEAKEGNDLKKTITLLEDHQPLPARSINAFHNISNAITKNSLTFENAFQTCLYSSYIDSLNQRSVEEIDMLNTSDIRTLAPTKKEAFNKTLQQTAYLALSEANLYHISTYKALQQKPLQLFTKKTPVNVMDYSDMAGVQEKLNYNFLIHDPSYQVFSYWQIDKKSGALLGILPDASGGGKNLTKESIKTHKKIMKKWAKHYVKAFGGGRSLSLVGMYAVELAATYGTVALLINDFNPNGLHLSFKGEKPSITI